MSHFSNAQIHVIEVTALQNFKNSNNLITDTNEHTQYKTSKTNNEKTTAQPKKANTRETKQKKQADAKRIAKTLRQFNDKLKTAACAYCKIRRHDVLVCHGLKYDYKKA